MLRFDIIKTVFRKELTESLRDRRSLAVMFGIPLLIYPLITLGFSSLGMQRREAMESKVYQVAVQNPDAAPRLVAEFGDKESGIKIVPLEGDAAAALANGRVDAVVVIPPDFEEAALESRVEEQTIRIRIDGSRTESQVVENKIEQAVNRYEKWILDRRLAERNLSSESILQPVETETDDIATAGQRLGKILGMALPNILLFTGMLGALFPAINAMTTEREVGTFEALLITPAKKIELLLAKGALVLLASVFTALINLVSMSLVLWRVVSLAGGERGALEITFMPLLLTFIAALPALIFFSALTMLVGLFARSFREANSYATPVMLIPMLSLAVSIMEPESTRALLATPVVNTTLIIRDVLAGRATLEGFVIAFVSSCIYAGLMLSWAARLFTSESLVNPSWEPLSWKGMTLRGGKRGRFGLPPIDGAIALFAIVLLLLFYVSPSFPQLPFVPEELTLFPTLLGNELLLITAPALLFVWLGRYDWVRTFSLRRASVPVYAGALLMGVGMALAIGLLQHFQQQFWKPDPQQGELTAKLILPALLGYPFLTIIGVGLLAGVCEEILFRGPIQAALGRRLALWPTILIGSFLFAALHMDLHGIPIRMLISLFLAWLVYRGHSIFPAMLMHTIYDSTTLFQAWWEVRGKTEAEIMAMADAGLTAEAWLRIVIGLLLLAVGWVICHRRFQTDGPAALDAELARAKLVSGTAGPT